MEKSRTRKPQPHVQLVDVVCTVGTVTVGDGDLTPMEAAMLLVARHGASGSYAWPGVVVTVELEA